MKQQSWWILYKQGTKARLFGRRPAAWRVLEDKGYKLIEVVKKEKNGLSNKMVEGSSYATHTADAIIDHNID